MPAAAAPHPHRVLVVDDHAFFRDGLVSLLRDCGIDVVADVPNGAAGLAQAARLAPDVVVVDLSMPGMDGIETTRRMVEQQPEARVVMLTVSQDLEDILQAVLAGASGFVLKDGPVEDILTAIDRATSGQLYFSDRVAPRLLRHVEGSRSRNPLNRLTRHESDALLALVRGSTLPDAAEQLNTSEKTVRQILTDIILKQQAESRGEIVARAVRDRIV